MNVAAILIFELNLLPKNTVGDVSWLHEFKSPCNVSLVGFKL